MDSNYIVPPACYLPFFYLNGRKLMEICKEALPPIKPYTDQYADGITAYVAEGSAIAVRLPVFKEWLNPLIETYFAKYKAEIKKFTSDNIHIDELLPNNCLTILYLHNVECKKVNEKVSVPLYPPTAPQAYEFINNNPEKTNLADQFMPQYHLQVLRELGDAEASMPIINSLNPMALSSELEQMIAMLQSCIAKDCCRDVCLYPYLNEGYPVDVFACIDEITPVTCTG